MGHVILADVSTGVTIGQLANGLIIGLAIAIVGGILAWLTAKNGTAEAAALSALTASSERQGAKLENLQLLTGELSTSLGPVLRELEALGAQLRNLDREVTILREWRATHDVWAKESIARLDSALHASRRTDTL